MAAVLTQAETPAVPPAAGRRRRPKRKWWRAAILAVAAIYFFLPMGTAIWFALYNDAQGFSWHAFTGMFGLPDFTSAFLLSVRLSVLTVALTLVLMVPTALLIHLKLPRWRKAVELACLLPLVVPPIVLVVGVTTVLSWGPGSSLEPVTKWLQQGAFPLLGKTPMILVFVYVVMALPFTYRALDAGLRTSGITNLVEAARSLGASWPRVVLSVAVPALRTSILNSAFLAFALAFGEFTVASILGIVTFTPWIARYNNYDGQLAVGVSILSLLITWGFLLIITAFGRTKSAKG